MLWYSEYYSMGDFRCLSYDNKIDPHQKAEIATKYTRGRVPRTGTDTVVLVQMQIFCLLIFKNYSGAI